MISFDVYRTTSEGTEWLGSFLDLKDAKAKLKEVVEPGDYFILDQSMRKKLFYHYKPRRAAERRSE